MKIQPAYQTTGVESTSMIQLRAVSEPTISSPKKSTVTGEKRKTGIESRSAKRKRLRMSSSIARATLGSDMSWSMPECSSGAPGWTCSCSASAALCGSSYCIRSCLVPQQIGASWASWPS
jgi:hypothetical protein